MKRVSALILLFLLLLTASSCAIRTRQDVVLESIGTYDSKVFYSSGGFQDYTDFAMYKYPSVSMDNTPYFSRITQSTKETLFAFIDNFEGWIDTIERSDSTNEVVVNYRFDRSIVDTEDYLYIYEGNEKNPFWSYDVYFFDAQTNVVYYFHSNI